MQEDIEQPHEELPRAAAPAAPAARAPVPAPPPQQVGVCLLGELQKLSYTDDGCIMLHLRLDAMLCAVHSDLFNLRAQCDQPASAPLFKQGEGREEPAWAPVAAPDAVLQQVGNDGSAF